MKVIKLAPNDGQQISFKSEKEGDYHLLYTGNIISIEHLPKSRGTIIAYLDPFGNRCYEESFLSLAEWFGMLPDGFVCISKNVVVNLRYVTAYNNDSVTISYRSGTKHFLRDRWNGKHPVEIDEVNY